MYRILTVLAVCGVGIAQQPCVGIFLDFEKTPPPAVVDALREHADWLLHQAGVVPAWRLLKDSKGGESFSDVFIVRFKGACHNLRLPLQAPSESDSATRLGATLVRNGEVLPWAEVECDAVKRGVATVTPKRRLFAFGQALAKVVTHELYHLLLNTTGHGATGLSRSVIPWSELTRTSAAFRGGEWDAYHARRLSASPAKGNPPRP
jgi:hypothetical protein